MLSMKLLVVLGVIALTYFITRVWMEYRYSVHLSLLKKIRLYVHTMHNGYDPNYRKATGCSKPRNELEAIKDLVNDNRQLERGYRDAVYFEDPKAFVEVVDDLVCRFLNKEISQTRVVDKIVELLNSVKNMRNIREGAGG